MTPIPLRDRLRLTLGASAVLAALLGLPAAAAAATADAAAETTATADGAATAPAAAGQEQEVAPVIVTAPHNQVTQVTPVRGALNETEPEAVITRKFIEESAPRVGDFSTIAQYAPSMAATPNPNGPGLSDGGKINMRGFADGQYNVTYDEIPWGDTNGPSHHGTAFFPSSTIGGIIIDRGPGDAGSFGQANFGGSVNLISLPLTDNASAAELATYASFDTWQSVTVLQTGHIAQLHGASFVADFQDDGSNGYLSNNYTSGGTEFIKGVLPVTDKITITGLYTHTGYGYNKSDIGDASVTQTTLFGPNFSLGSDPTLQDYFRYNWVKKSTDFAYLRGEGDLGRGFSFKDIVYFYDYDNITLSGANNLATASANVVTLTPGATYPAVGKAYPTALQSYGIPGYNKKNQYWVAGNILKFTQDFGSGDVTFGGLVERAWTYRYIFDINLLTGAPDYRQKAATAPGPSGVYVKNPLNIQYNEWSGWTQYQPFIELNWRPLPGLTISPSVKYVHFDLYVNAPVEALSVGNQPLYTDQVFTKVLPFLTINYQFNPHWSAYAQYAQGFLVPNIGNLYVANVSAKIVPQESTNYQLGTVLNLDNVEFDGDVYHIDFKHKIQSFTDAVTGQSYDTNSGGAYYEGVELQGAYVFPGGVSAFANGSINRAIGEDDPSNPLYNGHQLTSAPEWTAALGVRVQHDHLFVGDDSLIVTLDDKWVGDQYLINATCSNKPNGICQPGATLTPVTGLLPAWSEADLSMTYRIGHYSVEGQVLNLFDTRSLTSAKGSALIPGTSYYAQTVAQGGGNNALEYQVPRSFELTLKAKF
jgi:iron complex outermembrane receptor protein